VEVATLARRAGIRGGRGSLARTALCCVVLACVLTALMATRAAAKPASYVASDTGLVADYTAIEGAKLGVVLPGGPEHFFEVVESPKTLIPTPIGPALGTTACHDASGFGGGPPVTCVILVAKLPHLNGEIRQPIAHEVFHGFEAVMSGTLANFDSKPTKDWLIEGAATWVESDLIHKDRSARSDWKAYLKTPATLLFSRTYSAIGFFGHLASSGISPWSRFKAMFAAVGSRPPRGRRGWAGRRPSWTRRPPRSSAKERSARPGTRMARTCRRTRTWASIPRVRASLRRARRAC
jgi:hypothetical protein